MTVTDKSVETKILTVTYTQVFSSVLILNLDVVFDLGCLQTLPTTVFSTMTMTDVKTDTLLLTKTETLPVTLTSTSTLVDPTTLTMTDTVKEVLTDFVTKTDVSVIPTTVTSIWFSTDVIEMVSALFPPLKVGADGMLLDQHRRAHSYLDRH